jgi:EAL domain-containing protein (putative c-di-GMP-specific phosphodiesterase class I)
VGFEALVRWQRSKGVFVPPSDFIGIAEETGLIVPIGAFVLREACQQLREWQGRKAPGPRPLMMSVNLSARQFAQPDLAAQVARVARETGLTPGSLKLEVTESVLMQDPEAAAAMLTELDAQKVEVCIDDFGTGYSSLSHLLRLPARTLKVDRSFVHGMSLGKQHAEMVRTIVALARNLEMDVIAEGVETEEQKARLTAMECDYAQGYLISRPVDAKTAQSLLEREALPLAGPSAERD